MSRTRLVALATAAALVALSGCEQRTARRFPKVELLDELGNARTSVEFGQVQLNFTAAKTVRVRNAGNVALTLSAAAFSNPKFAVGAALPVSIDVAGEYELPLTFTPDVADQRETGTVTITTDDPDKPTVQLSLAGTGVTATVVLQPQTLDFGEVYVGETKDLTVTFTNSGSNALPVTSVGFGAGAPATVTADLTPWQTTLAGGESRMVTFRFAPTARGAVTGSVELVFPMGVPSRSLAITGTGIQALPRLCFQFDGTGTEQCTDGTQALDVRFGSLCDSRVYPADGGLVCELDGGAVPYSRAGRFYVRNEGNTSVAYTLQITAGQPTRCNGQASTDFTYANATRLADGGMPPSFNVATTRLPLAVSDPMPWETAPVAVSYAARSACIGDDSDISTIAWTRQMEPLGTMRRPNTLIATLTGASVLSEPEPNPVTFMGNQPTPQDVTLVSNTGDGPVRLTGVELFQSSDGGLVPDESCTTATSGPCTYFAWVAGPTVPVLLEGTNVPAARVQKTVGRLAFGTLDAGLYYPPSQPQRVFAVVDTSDPYTPTVTVPIIGRLQ